MSYCLTAHRVTLLSVFAVLSSLALILNAEIPLASSLQIAVALQKAGVVTGAPIICDGKLLRLDEPLESFDPRKHGYTEAEALQILCAMSANGEAGKKAYLYIHFPLDMIFLLLYGPAIAAIWLFLMRELNWPLIFRTLAVLPLFASLCDFAENLTVRQLVLGGPTGALANVRIASLFTQTKYACVLGSIVPALVLLLWYLGSRSLARRRNSLDRIVVDFE